MCAIMNQSLKTYFVTLNWNTTDLLVEMIESVERATPEPHEWIIIDNGSMPKQKNQISRRLYSPWFFSDSDLDYLSPDVKEQRAMGQLSSTISARRTLAYVEFLPRNIGCVLGHNRAFAIAKDFSQGEPHQIVMIDTDVVVSERNWLSGVMAWGGKYPEVGIIGFEHGPDVACAPAVGLDPGGYWYLHEEQMRKNEPVEAESVGLGFALIRWPVLNAGLRFDTAYEMYYKQDDDLCFQVRADLGMQVWVYPVNNIHAGSGSLQANGYQCGEANGWDEFDQIKQKNQALFATKWAWALRGRRKNMAEEAAHLEEMRRIMRERREAKK